MSDRIEELKKLNAKLSKLLEDPELASASWESLVCTTIIEMAEMVGI